MKSIFKLFRFVAYLPILIIKGITRLFQPNSRSKLFISEFFLIVLSICLAYILWLITMYSSLTTRSLSIPIIIRNIPKEATYLIESPASHHLNIEVTCPKNLTNAFNSSNFFFDLDFANQDPDLKRLEFSQEQSITLSMIKPMNLPSLVTLTDVYPKTIRFQVRYYHKKVPIKINIKGKPARYHHVIENSYQIEPKEIEIIGPKIALDNIEFITTEVIPIKGKKESFETDTALNFPASIRSFKLVKKAKFSVKIEENIIEKTVRNIEIRKELLYPNIETKYTPMSADIVLKGPISLVEKVKKSDIHLPLLIPREEGTIEKELQASLSEELDSNVLQEVSIEKIIPPVVSIVNQIIEEESKEEQPVQ